LETAKAPVHVTTYLKPKRSIFSYLALVLILVAIYGSYLATEINPALFFATENQKNILAFIKGMFPPDLSLRFLKLMAKPAAETIQISVIGIVMAIFIGLALAFFATSTLTFTGILSEMESVRFRFRKGIKFLIYLVSRALLNILRSVPEFIWALLFVRLVGLGPFAGVLAIGVAYGGTLGKIYAEILESVESKPLEALQATGASRLEIIFYGLLPAAIPNLASYTLYRWECAIRAGAILGLVGAGGLGQQIELSMRMFNYHEVTTLILIIFLIVTIVDNLSAYLRRKIV
jgi:phosphonate transport system permease protein